ncbi:MAG: hypothetical protein M3O50_18295 [Myxococcota bacterium]|nr:hypothetical protein [Myxococcota bacterium]
MSKEFAPRSRPTQADLDRLLRAQDWGDIRARLVRIARSWTGPCEDAEELADAAIVDACDPLAAPWDLSEQPDVLRHAVGLMRRRLSAARKKQRVRADPKNVAAVAALGPGVLDPAQQLEDAERQERDDRVFRAARERLSELDRVMLDLWRESIDKPADQTIRLGLPIEEIRRARERIKYALRAAIEDDEAP